MNSTMYYRIMAIVAAIAILNIVFILAARSPWKEAPAPVLDAPENLCPSIKPWTVDLEISGNTRLTMTIYCEEDPITTLGLNGEYLK